MSMNNLSEFFWDDLLSHIEEGQVIPIVGQDLLTVETAGAALTYYELLASRLVEQLSTDARNPLDPLPPNYSLSQVVGAYAPFREKRQLVYPRIKSIVDKTPVPTPAPLRELAAITGFHLFVSTTFDTLLAQALNEERFAGRAETTVVKYAPDDVADLPKDYSSGRGTAVFQLMGQVSASPKYTVTECDQLEFIHQLQTADLRPQRLLDELNKKHLLLLGNSFCDGLARFFLRLTQREPLWKPRETLQVLADSQVHDQRLALFLNHFNCETTVIRDATAVEFVKELFTRWQQRHPAKPDLAAAPQREGLPIPEGAIFVSYARQDSEAAHQLKASLDEYGLEVWLDQKELQPGDEYEKLIQRHIRHCALFLPVISRNTEQRKEGFFRKEWFWAVRRLPDFTGADRKFIFPVVVDDTPPYEAQVPQEFKEFQWAFAPGGKPPTQFLENVRTTIRELRKG